MAFKNSDNIDLLSLSAGQHPVAEGQRAAVDEGPPREGLLLRPAVADHVRRRQVHDVALRSRKGKQPIKSREHRDVSDQRSTVDVCLR